MDIFSAFQKISRMATKALLERFSSKQKRQSKEGFFQHPKPSSPLFGSRRYVHRSQLKEFFEEKSLKAPIRIKGAGKLTREDLVSMAQEDFPKKRVGGYITLSEFKKTIRNLKKSRRRARSPIERQKIRTKIKFLESLLPKRDEK